MSANHSRQRDLKSYGLIGNCKSAALIDVTGSIDWLCLPRFDSASLFARLLDREKGGYFRIAPSAYIECRQNYVADTNILQTEFFGANQEKLSVKDFMPISEAGVGQESIVRIIENFGEVEVEAQIECLPRFNYARVEPEVRIDSGNRVVFESPGRSLVLVCDTGTEWTNSDSGVTGKFRIKPRERVAFKADFFDGTFVSVQNLTSDPFLLLKETHDFWLRWSSRVRASGEFEQTLKRSALTLKLFTYEPTGGVIAAPSTSLPEEIGGVRNWDYRYVWLRDATFVVDAFYQIGHPEDGRAFINWMRETAKVGDQPIKIAYSILGDRQAPEFELDYLEGYRGSRPVRVGNGAFEQTQLDVYGEIINCIDNCRSHKDPVAVDLWKKIPSLIEWVCVHWREPDMGIWEVRGEPQHFVYSKVMAWVALDRAITSSHHMQIDEATVSGWKKISEEIRDEIFVKGWDAELGSFVQAYGSKRLDAANLRMPLVDFISASNPKMRSTISATKKYLSENDLVFRYRGTDDGIEGGEASFAICTFWLIQNLILLGELADAETLLRKALSFGSGLGLYSEEIDPRSGELLGNYPQSFTHVGIINSIIMLERARHGDHFINIGRSHYEPSYDSERHTQL